MAFESALRYTIPEAALLLKQGVSTTWRDIKEGKLAVIKEGSRTFVPGSEIERRCNLAIMATLAAPLSPQSRASR